MIRSLQLADHGLTADHCDELLLLLVQLLCQARPPLYVPQIHAWLLGKLLNQLDDRPIIRLLGRLDRSDFRGVHASSRYLGLERD